MMKYPLSFFEHKGLNLIIVLILRIALTDHYVQ
jgi:hypothetical protein